MAHQSELEQDERMVQIGDLPKGVTLRFKAFGGVALEGRIKSKESNGSGIMDATNPETGKLLVHDWGFHRSYGVIDIIG